MNMSRFAIPKKCKIPKDAYGVWQVPDRGIIIPVYKGTNATAQAIIDTDYAASIEKYGVGMILNDHADSKTDGSGLWNVCDFTPDTVGFMVTKDTTYCYTCVFVCRAYRQNTCYIMDGASVYPHRQGDILCVSCATADASEVYIAEFRQTGEIPT